MLEFQNKSFFYENKISYKKKKLLHLALKIAKRQN